MKRLWLERSSERNRKGKSVWTDAAQCVKREMVELPREARKLIDPVMDGDDLGLHVRGIRLR